MKKWITMIFVLLILGGCAQKEPSAAPKALPEQLVEEETMPVVEPGPPIQKEPGDLTVFCGPTSVNAMRGTSSWMYDNGDGTSTGFEACGVHPLDSQDSMPMLDLKDDSIRLEFAGIQPDRVTVRCWSVAHWGGTSAVSEDVAMDGMSFEAKPGGYVYEINAEWEQGSALYSFCGAPLGVTLTTEDVTAAGGTIVCTQEGGSPSGELETGGYYWLEVNEDGYWSRVPLKQENVTWTEEAWIIPMGETVKWEVDWEWLYGELPAGRYRIGKEIMDFRGPGDYDEYRYVTDIFVIE